MTIGEDLFRLNGKVAIVTGAGGREGGIGESYAAALGRFGAKVAVADLNPGGAITAATRLQQQGIDAIGIGVDVADAASVTAMVKQTEQAFGGIDILVNNAALMVEILKARAGNIDLDLWNRILAVNVTGPMLCAQAVIPSMRERGGGRIVNQVSSGAYPAQNAYGISKLALVGLTTALAFELGSASITVNAIAPGVTDSGAGLSLRTNPSPYFQMLEKMVPLRVRGTPDELCGALLYLCSDAGAWTTGQVLHVDGGAVVRP